MGGCRCTYRNCTVRSDGKTHLFHFPVFDKVRCNQWLTNARRYDFLNLKVSQLKNRCICQHHFADHCFMNTMKDKLKVEAVPTLDGPYCDSENFETPEVPDNTLGLYPIPREEIEHDEYISDRKANYNKKYADFLTNCEIVDIETKQLDIDENKRIKTHVLGHNKRAKNILHSGSAHNKILENNVSSQARENTTFISNEIQTVPVAFVNNFTKPVLMNQRRNKSKINIISEKKITEPERKIPVPVSSGSFKLVSPSMVLNINKNRNEKDKNNEEIINAKYKPIRDNESTITEILSTNDPRKFEIKIDIEEVNPQAPTLIPHQEEEVTVPNSAKSHKNCLEKKKTVGNSVLNCMQEKKVALYSKGIKQKVTEMINFDDPCHDSSKEDAQEWIPVAQKNTPENKTSKVVMKNKISPERLAAINEKRKFNMKLKDIIEAGLNQLHTNETAKNENMCPKSKILNSKLETVATSLAKDSVLPDNSDYIMSYLEDRMRKMENLLLNKIDQNTQKIMELKKSFDSPELALDKQPSKLCTKSKDLHGEAHKKKLFKEISKYLTPDASSLVYEELFINKYKPNVLITDREPLRKRKRR